MKELSTPSVANAALETYIQALTEGDGADRKAHITHVLRRNAIHWDQQLRADPERAYWRILEALVARVDVRYAAEPESVFYATELAEVIAPPAWMKRRP